MEMLVVVVLLVTCRIAQSDMEIGKDIDYSDLAGEAEINKKNLLSFLNGNEITNKYRKRFINLLNKLEDNVPVKNRRESTRRIVSGRNTSISAVPWQVSLQEKSYPICGGSVLTDIWIISAAHCLRFKAMYLSVRVGSSWKMHGGEIYDVKESFIHPNYIGKQKINDVGLVRLYTALRFSSRVLPIKLVARDAKLPAGVPAIVSGWGKLKEGGPSTAYLQSSTIKTIAMKLCRWSGLKSKTIDPASMFCAGSFLHLSPDTCQGDSGGPIVHDGVLIGVVSWGLGCARGNFPGVYSRLAYPLIWDWVHKHILVKNDNKTML